MIPSHRCWWHRSAKAQAPQHLHYAAAVTPAFAHKSADPLSVRRVTYNIVPFGHCRTVVTPQNRTGFPSMDPRLWVLAPTVPVQVQWSQPSNDVGCDMERLGGTRGASVEISVAGCNSLLL